VRDKKGIFNMSSSQIYFARELAKELSFSSEAHKMHKFSHFVHVVRERLDAAVCPQRVVVTAYYKFISLV
jgi:hypothetical protein